MAETQHSVAPASAGHDTALGFDATGWVAITMIVVIGIMFWQKVPAIIGKALDGQIAKIRATLDEAASLRAEAESLRDQMAAKLTASDAEAKAVIAAANAEATAMLAKAQADAEALILRRRAAAEAKIAVAERAAVARVRDAVVTAATDAARSVIAAKTDATTQNRLTDSAISELGARLN